VWLYLRRLGDGSVKYALRDESPDAAKEAIRAPALMRRSIGQCFRECKKHLGMDHYGARSWPAWRRHILFTLIAHLPINKLRARLGATVDTPGPTPLLDAPVPLDGFRRAVREAQGNQAIGNPNIRVCPKGPQKVLTIAW
jgi:hypothetical protein